MQIIRKAGSQASVKGPEEYFTGTVRIDPLFPAMEGSVVSGALVTFEPDARSAWHTHPMGQNLLVISGMGWMRCEGGPKVESGQATWFPARAGKGTAMARRRLRL